LSAPAAWLLSGLAAANYSEPGPHSLEEQTAAAAYGPRRGGRAISGPTGGPHERVVPAMGPRPRQACFPETAGPGPGRFRAGHLASVHALFPGWAAGRPGRPGAGNVGKRR